MDPKEYLNLLEKALLDILDGTSAGDIQSITGMKLERSIEIVNLIPIIEEQRKLKTNSEGMLMPDMHGCEVFKYLKEINPNIKVIVMSGYCTNEDKVKMHAFGCTFLQKPVMPREIDRHIKKVLGVANEIGQK